MQERYYGFSFDSQTTLCDVSVQWRLQSENGFYPYLKEKSLNTVLSEIRVIPPRQAVSALLSPLCHTDENVKWHAVSVLGVAMKSV
jgi:hypothetical protein